MKIIFKEFVTNIINANGRSYIPVEDITSNTT